MRFVQTIILFVLLSGVLFACTQETAPEPSHKFSNLRLPPPPPPLPGTPIEGEAVYQDSAVLI
ncbi:hypothetical protein J4211_05200 [Candidatus Woesearchaeota archaeon]|nr:hypothetical protein [Candidatus Woesearchaeota archaeon]